MRGRRTRQTTRVLQAVVVVAVVAVTVGATRGLAQGHRALAVPHSLVGCWSRHVRALPVGTSAGVWLVRIRSNGAFAAYTPGSERCDSSSDFVSHVSVSSGRLTIGHVPICASNGVYTVKTSKNSFTLHTVSDKACAARVGLLAGVWKRKT
jgi:hypothetical protein